MNDGRSPSGRAVVPSASSPAVSPVPASIPSAEIERIASAAFKAGWDERNRNPGLKKRERNSLDNLIRSACGGRRFNDFDYVPDERTYHRSIWLRSQYRMSLAQVIEARRAETERLGAQHESAVAESDAPNSSQDTHPGDSK
jgi:hypothetical protein